MSEQLRWAVEEYKQAKVVADEADKAERETRKAWEKATMRNDAAQKVLAEAQEKMIGLLAGEGS